MYQILILAGAVASALAFMDSMGNFSNCTTAQFTCGNLQCVPESKRCDGRNDCTDSSDEADCDMYLCKPPEFFRCRNQRCLSSAFVCDGENDCDDFSDEENCEEFKKSLQKNTTCEENQWKCSDNLCVFKEWVCDGKSDCLDGSDETLGCSVNITCDGFKCKNGHCIPNEWRCDGQDDCRDNSDEANCEFHTKPEDCTLDNQRFLCETDNVCIHLSQVCDGISHCPDQSDEGTACNATCAAHDCSHRCLLLPTGPKCVCPEGYRTIDEKNCEDINECEIFGICDQKCRNFPSSYECYCDEDYTLQKDKKTCKVNSGEPILFFSTKKEIRGYLLKSNLYFSVAKNLKQVVGVDFDGDYVYWTEIFAEHESIMRSLKDGTSKEVLVTSGLGAPEDLHVDHVTRNIYFTDAERQHIGVCSNDGRHCTVLVNKDVHKPRGIVLHPEEGQMYWTDWGRSPEIGRALMDGTACASFVSSEVHWPNGLALDAPNSRLYWTDAKLATVESVRLDGTDRRVVLEGVARHPYALALFEDTLYWSDWATKSLQSCHKFTGKGHRTLVKEAAEYVYGVAVYHPAARGRRRDPCASAGCSHLCVLKGQNYACVCPQGSTLEGHTCRETEKRQMLILGAGRTLVHVEHRALGRPEAAALPVTVKKVGALAYSSTENVLFVSDVEIRKIVKVNLHSGITEVVNGGELGQITAMDYDYMGNNLYWCDSEKGTVEVLDLNTNSRKVLVHDVHGEIPESLALVPEEGVMFVSFKKSNKRESHIDRMSMDGSERTHSIDVGILGPITLFYDHDLHRIFLADAGTGNIESTSVEGDDRHGFRSLLTSPVGITSLKREIFWTNNNSRSVYWADKYGGSDNDYNKKITLDLSEDVGRMHVVSVTPQIIGLSPCQSHNGQCSHLCLQSKKRVVCACPNWTSLDKDNKTCIKRSDCTSNQFFCSKSNICVSNKDRCDGVKDCPEGEDEDNCKTPNHCPSGTFQCKDGECIGEEERCDHSYDCRDKSDEHNCSFVESKFCPPKHFKCEDGQCIEERFVCDGTGDCLKNEDEVNCVESVCGNSEFRCLSGACIPKSWECDHEYDCPDNSDEHQDCAPCPPASFRCSNGRCLSPSFRCDGRDDCGDASDEAECAPRGCAPDELACGPHLCLPSSARCDGVADCPHHEDERNCSECHVEEFACKNGRCLPRQWLCDGSDDCGDRSDEEEGLCGERRAEEGRVGAACGSKEFRCSSGNCVDLAMVCNGEIDCFDGSDEGGLCNTSCNAINNPCGQICVRTPTGPMCKCKTGFYLRDDGQSCQDVDECREEVCSQICHNSDGGHSCDCYEGFVLRTDRISCKAEGKAMSLIFTADDQIRELSQTENSLKLVHSEATSKIIGLDVDVKRGSIYFSIDNYPSIFRIRRNSSVREQMTEAGNPQILALDWLTGNVYYVNSELNSKSISLCNFEDKICSSLIQTDPHRQVSAIAVDSANRYLFYSLISWWIFSAPSYVIYRTNLDGSGALELVGSTIGYVTGLTYDLHKKQLFYVDQHGGLLGKVNYDGTMSTVIIRNLTHPRGLDFFENHLYFKTSGGLMEKCKLYEPISCESFKLNGQSNDLFVAVQESKQPEFEGNLCKDHNCSHLCVPGRSSYRCLCGNGKVASPNEECDENKRDAHMVVGESILQMQRGENGSSGNGGVVVGTIVMVCLVVSVVLYVLVKRKNSGTFNVSMKFSNPTYGLQFDEAEKSILTLEHHEYSNPVAFYEGEANNKKEDVLVNV